MINRIKIFLIVFALIILMPSIFGCFAPASTASTETSGTQTQQSSESSATTTTETQTSVIGNKVVIENFTFNPSELQIKVGETVTWTNMDSAPHTVNSDLFNSDTLNNGDSFSFTFDKAGTYDYICGIHPAMKGKIVVK